MTDTTNCDTGGDCECKCTQFEHMIDTCEKLLKPKQPFDWRDNNHCREFSFFSKKLSFIG